MTCAAANAWAAIAAGESDAIEKLSKLTTAVAVAAAGVETALREHATVYTCGALERAGWLANDGARWAAVLLRQARRTLNARDGADADASVRAALCECAEAVTAHLNDVVDKLGRDADALAAALVSEARIVGSSVLPPTWESDLVAIATKVAEDQVAAANAIADSLAESATWSRGAALSFD